MKYVALSRAKDYLYIIVPTLSEETEQLIVSTNLYYQYTFKSDCKFCHFACFGGVLPVLAI